MKLCKISKKSIVSLLLICVMISSMLPGINVFAAQTSEYIDPAENWLTSNGRTNELDINANTTYETQYCCVCNMVTTVLTYRVPEYTRSGETAANRGVKFSDGASVDGKSRGNLDDGTPGVDASYTGYHWTKAVCQNCGTINTVDGYDAYNFNNNVYGLNACDHSFFVSFDATTHVPYNDQNHLTTLKAGEYCQFCKGTYAVGVKGLRAHNYKKSVDAQLGNNRFCVDETCSDCGYKSAEYITAKSVVSSYYGVEDGEAHTLTVTDLSDKGVKTSIRYGNSADSCTKTSAPNYTKAGYYNVYYEIKYTYGGETMTENGVSYVCLVADNKNDDNGKDGTIIVIPPTHEHEFHYLETVKPTCTELGYERFQCAGCGELDKRNYSPAAGHSYNDVLIREATCKQGGLLLTLCKKCGDFYQTTTALGNHKYKTVKHNASCHNVGYTEHTCDVCGNSYITDMTPLIAHAFERITKEPTCLDKGYTTSTCTMCGYNYVSDYTDPTGHKWDKGTTITNSTCAGEGVIEYKCEKCNEKMIKATSAKGHNPGPAATCTQPQTCLDCGTVLENEKGHSYSEKVTKPTCTSMGYTTYTCDSCGDTYDSNYTDKINHDYTTVVTKPTCTAHGYTTYSCKNCDSQYVSDYVDAIPHNYNAVITKPTCTKMGYTTFTCLDCGSSYVNNYTDMVEHNYNKEVIEPTCTEHGYSIYTCPDCGKSYIGDYTDNKKHTYVQTVIPPTCTSLGYTIFKCNDCDDSYKGDYVDKLPHAYKAVVTEATCTEHGYTTYTCANCGDTYVSAYKEAAGHKPSDWIIDLPATIGSAGEKHIECVICGTVLSRVAINQLADKDRTNEDGNAVVGGYDISLIDETGTPIFNSEISIDVYDKITIKLPKNKLLDFGNRTIISVINTADKTPAKGLEIYISDSNSNNATGNTDDFGKLIVPNNTSSTGDTNGTIGTKTDENNKTYVVSVTNKENVVIENCNIKIGESNDIVINLPDKLVLTSDSPAIVTVLDQNGTPQQGISIIVIGKNDYIEKGRTDVYGKLTVPNVYDGYTDKDGRVHVNGRNIFVADELGNIENAYVKMNDDESVSVMLPDGKIITHHNRTTVSIYDRMGVAIKDVAVTVADNKDNSKSGVTDDKGQVTVPPINEDYSDDNGAARVSGYDIKVKDETGTVSDAFVYYDELNEEIIVALPENKKISFSNRIYTEVSKDGAAVEGMKVAVTDMTENGEIGFTDENGIAVVPPLNKDITDSEGNAAVDGYNVLIEDEIKPIEDAFIAIGEGQINVVLPAEALIDVENKITATITDKDKKPVKDMTVIFTDAADRTESNVTNEYGQATVPPSDTDVTDFNGFGEVSGFIVTIKNKLGPVEKAHITYNAEVKDETGTVTADENIAVILPENIFLVHDNRITVTVARKADNTPVKDMTVTVTEAIIKSEETNTELSEAPTPKSLSGKTDKDGIIIIPANSENVTDKDGKTDVTDTKPGTDTDGDGKSDTDDVKTLYNIVVENTNGKIEKAFIEVKDGKITVKLPDNYSLSTSNQTTVTVTNEKNEVVKGISVTITDKTTSASGTTDSNGKVILPVKSSGGGSSSGGGGRGSGGGGGGYIASNTTNITVTDKNGKSVSSVSKSTDKDGKITLTLPNGTGLSDGNYYTIKATDSKGNAKADVAIVVKDKKNNSADGVTDKNGMLIVPATEHMAYVFGYNDGTFRPDNNMTRAEAAAIFARHIAEYKGEKISGRTDFADVNTNDWFANYIGYLEKYNIIKGYPDNTFRPNDSITRSEFVAITVRFNSLFNEVKIEGNSVKYTDVAKSDWAYNDIAYAKNAGWINGYADGSFKGDAAITRAEVITIVNRATNRKADENYISKNLSVLNKFTDIRNNSMWYFFDVIESCNEHKATVSADNEIWLK